MCAWATADESEQPTVSATDLARYVSVQLKIPNRDALRDLFESRIKYFGRASVLALLENRVEQMPERQAAIYQEGIEPTAPATQTDSLLLLLAHPSLKGIVWESAAVARAQFQTLGIDSGKFWNRYDVERVLPLVNECSAQLGKQFVDTNLNPLLTESIGHTWGELSNNAALSAIYADELARALFELLHKRKSAYGPQTVKRLFIEGVLKQWQPESEVQFEIVPRNLESFVGGKLAGDCTKLGQMNDWTLGAWNLTFENIEVRILVNKKFSLAFCYSPQNAKIVIHSLFSLDMRSNSPIGPSRQNPRRLGDD